MTSLRFNVGRFLCGTVRDYLNSERFMGRSIEFIESSGFLERTFTVRGKQEDVERVMLWMDRLRAADQEGVDHD
jgi:hypothetical protein